MLVLNDSKDLYFRKISDKYSQTSNNLGKKSDKISLGISPWN